jgi:hypothetical protein
MDIKQLLEKMDQFAGEKVGQKPGDQWRGTDKGIPGKKLVGGSNEQQESVLKDLSKGATPKTREQELAEEWATFSEENIGTHPKRVGRTSDRHSRGHKPQARYTTIKADEAANPAQQAAIAMAMKKAGKKPKNEGVAYKTANPHPASRDPIVAKVLKQMRPGLTGLDMNNEAFLYFAYEIGKMRAREMWVDYGPAIKYSYQSGIGVNEGWESGPEEYEEPYDDADDAYDRQRQGKLDAETEAEWAKKPKKTTYKLTGRGPNMEPNHEFGGEFSDLDAAKEYRRKLMADPKTPHPEHIGIRTIERVIDEDQINEASFNPPKDKEDYDAKMGMLWKLQQDPNTHKDPVLKQKIIWQMNALRKAGEQAGYINNDIKDINDYQKRRDVIYRQLANPANVANYSRLKQELINLNNLARKQGIKIEESQAYDKLSKWFKDRDRAQKFASGELKVPTPQERRSELEKSKDKKEKVDEYGADNPQLATGANTATAAPQKVDPKQAQQVAQNLNVEKTALGQLKQLNPAINPQKAALAATKDLATMNPQEKEALAQVAKTLSPALGSPAFGSIKTALQKAKNT